jgi:hypothetical protein
LKEGNRRTRQATEAAATLNRSFQSRKNPRAVNPDHQENILLKFTTPDRWFAAALSSIGSNHHNNSSKSSRHHRQQVTNQKSGQSVSNNKPDAHQSSRLYKKINLKSVLT